MCDFVVSWEIRGGVGPQQTRVCIGFHGRSEDGFVAVSEVASNPAGDSCCGHVLIGLCACVVP